MLQKKLAALESQNMRQNTVSEFTQLISFIDRSLTEALKLDGGEKIATLSNALFNIRDFMRTSLSQDGYRQILIAEVRTALNHVEPEAQEETAQALKKKLELERQLGNAQ